MKKKNLICWLVCWFVCWFIFAALSVCLYSVNAGVEGVGTATVEKVTTATVEGVAGSGDTCPGGTYIFDWDGELSTAVKACLESGATEDGTESSVGNIAVAGGAINGNIGALLDADGEFIRDFAIESNSLEYDGTIECQVTTPSDISADDRSFAGVSLLSDRSNNHILMYSINGNLYGRFRIGGTAQTSASAAMTASSTHTLKYTWRNHSTDRHCVQVDSDGWQCQNEALDDTAITFDDGHIGESVSLQVEAGTWKVDDCQIREGYEGT